MRSTYSHGILFDDDAWEALLPLTLTRPVAEIRIGILTIREKWEKWTGIPFGYHTQDYLRKKYRFFSGKDNLLVNGSVTPADALIGEIAGLENGEMLVDGDRMIAARFSGERTSLDIHALPDDMTKIPVKSTYRRINRSWHIFQHNGQELASDFMLITRNRSSVPLNLTNNLIQKENIFVEEGASIEYVTLNASSGPIYIGKNTQIMEGSMIRGPFALCEGSQVKMGTKIYGPTTIGPASKAGGEITNSILFANSNKVHDGFLGNSVIGQWCNIGAGTNASNLKNNYDPVRIWEYATGRFQETGLQFCGLTMGDYSKCGINTMFNSGTVVGICTNVYGAGFPRSFIPSFSKGGAAGFKTDKLDGIFMSIERQMIRRNQNLTEEDRNIIRHVHDRIDRYHKG